MKHDIHNLKDNLQDLGWLDRSYRKHNIIVHGLIKGTNESRWDLCYKLLDLFSKELKINICDYMVDDCCRLGKKRNKRPALISFTSTLITDRILERAKLLKGTKIFLERDHDFKTRSIRAQLIAYMREARAKGKHAILSYDKLLIERTEVDLHYCKNNMEISRNVELGDRGRVDEEEKSKNTEVGQQNVNNSRPSTSQADLSNLRGECNNEKKRGSVGESRQRRISTEFNATSHASQEHARSRSNSSDLPGSPRGMTVDTQPRLTFSNSNRQDRSTTNRGAEGNFHNLRSWMTKSQ